MSQSKEWQEYHLTTNGWVRGSYRTDFGGETLEPPPDRVLSLRFVETINFGNINQYFTAPQFESEDKKAIEALLCEFGSCRAEL